jgi:hypothetical protein
MTSIHTKISLLSAVCSLVFAAQAIAQSATKPAAAESSVRFEKVTLTPRYFCDGISAGDINRDGHQDIVAGPYWYAGPTFREAHAFYPAVPIPPEQSPSDSLFSFIYDFNADGWPDILVLGRVHLHAAYWYENPKAIDKPWPKHFVFERVRGESPLFVDLDGDGRPQVVCHWNNRWGWIEPNWDSPAEPWSFHPLSEVGDWPEFYHGTGVGDINGDSRLDLVLNDGWFEQPKESGVLWAWHPHRFSPDRGGAQMFVYDVDGDGDNDVISSLNAHGWGLAWFEQQRTGDGAIDFEMHQVMGKRDEIDRYGVAFTQPHALDFGDINGDGLTDVVVGKRRWAHGPKGDIEPEAEPVIYWFELVRDKGEAHFKPHLIDNESGVGLQITVTDINGDGKNDVLSASKLGSFLFLNQR